MSIHAKVSERVGGLKVHVRPASSTLVEPKELWPGYHVEIVDERQRQKLWARINYIWNNHDYSGWVIKEALDVIDPPRVDTFDGYAYPPDVPRPDVLGAPLPPAPSTGHVVWPWLALIVAITVIAIVANGLLR